MWHLPDLSLLFYLAIFGLICGVFIVLVGGSWAGYHLFVAICEYAGYCAR